eukprot:scaffold4103_cov20-Prasinocladus_malaysianus.AAC.1
MCSCSTRYRGPEVMRERRARLWMVIYSQRSERSLRCLWGAWHDVSGRRPGRGQGPRAPYLAIIAVAVLAVVGFPAAMSDSFRPQGVAHRR